MNVEIHTIIWEYLKQRSVLVESIANKPHPHNRDRVAAISRIDQTIFDLLERAEVIEIVEAPEET